MIRNFLLTLVLAIVCTLQISAQEKNPLINSAEILQQAAAALPSHDFKKAIELCSSIDRNDTNYVWAQYNLSLVYNADGQFEKTIECCKRILALRLSWEKDPEIYKTYDYALLRLDRSQEAKEIMSEAISRFPRYEENYYLKGEVCMILKEYPEADSLFKKCLMMNPFRIMAHYGLAKLEVEKGNFTPAVLIYFTCLSLEPDGLQAAQPLAVLDTIAKRINYDQFANKSFTPITYLDIPTVRLAQLVFQNLHYEKNSKEFWKQYYLPLFMHIMEKKQFEILMSHSLQKSNLPAIKQYLDKNIDAEDELVNQCRDYFGHIRETRTLAAADRDTVTIIDTYNKDNLLVSRRKIDPKTRQPNGYGEDYYADGTLKLKGNFNAKGESGRMYIYYANGPLSNFRTMKDNLPDGEYMNYFPNGNKEEGGTYVNNIRNGRFVNYFENGELQMERYFRHDTVQGRYNVFSENGALRQSGQFQSNKLEGEVRQYAENGRLQNIGAYKDGKQDGPAVSYDEFGHVATRATMKEGQYDGHVITYHPNGKIRLESWYRMGVQDKEEKQYYDNGNLGISMNFINGVSDGQIMQYREDGTLSAVSEMKAGVFKSIAFYDRQGKQISLFERKDTRVEIDEPNEDGFPLGHSYYNSSGLLDGEGKIFYPSGALRIKTFYVQSDYNNVTEEFLPDGKKMSEYMYSKGKKDGYQIKYYHNGQIQEEGWQIEDLKQGYWLSYDELGHLTDSSYFLNNRLNGYRTEFYPDGTKDVCTRYENGKVMECWQFDSAGKIYYHQELPRGTGIYTLKFPNGKSMIQIPMLNGYRLGASKSWYFDGRMLSETYYWKGLQDSIYRSWYPNGKLKEEGRYDRGKKSGIWKNWLPNGSLFSQTPYIDGQINGVQTMYYEDGKTDITQTFKNDLKDGLYSKYEEGGQLMFQMTFKKGGMMSYSWQDKNGQMVPTAALPGQSGKIKTYYPNGSVSSEFEIKDNFYIGSYTYWYPNGRLKQTLTMDMGLQEGPEDLYYPSGQMKQHYEYLHNKRHGLYRIYHENGSLKETGVYYLGSHHGLVHYFDGNGKQVLTERYYFDRLQSTEKD